jgi:2-polyprenyl-6-methoxyphenol hydroxylase-like FAD-dependent oxidoreductase
VATNIAVQIRARSVGRVNERADAPAAIADTLRRRAADFPEPVPQLLTATAPEAIVRNDLYDVSLKTWHHGRIVLLGDAAHAMTPNLGQGAAQAMEDAYVLADALKREPTPQAAFQSFEKARRAKANEIVRASWLLGKLVQARGPIGRTARKYVLKSTPDLVTRWRTHRLFRLGY